MRAEVITPEIDQLLLKQQQFNTAMDRYGRHWQYEWVGRIASWLNVFCPILLAWFVFRQSIGVGHHLLAFILAFIAADMINGVVHMIMDNHDDYTSWAGPWVAAFHLHHRTPRYTVKPWPLVYYHEAGSKLWLAILMLPLIWVLGQGIITGGFAYGIFYFTVLSCLAEVSHYCCHVPQTRLAQGLRRIGVFIPKKYHMQHHFKENTQYTFLNGMTDPIVNLIAKWLYAGYKATTDHHYATYQGMDTENRA